MQNTVIAQGHQLEVCVTIRLGPVTPEIFCFRLDGVKKNCGQLSGNFHVLRLQVFKKDTR